MAYVDAAGLADGGDIGADVGGVVVGLGSDAEVRQAFASMLERVAVKAPQAAIDGVIVAPMVKGMAELILGSRTDPVSYVVFDALYADGRLRVEAATPC